MCQIFYMLPIYVSSNLKTKFQACVKINSELFDANCGPKIVHRVDTKCEQMYRPQHWNNL